jgi:hypothetical protein
MRPVVILATGRRGVYKKKKKDRKCVQEEIQWKNQRIKHM